MCSLFVKPSLEPLKQNLEGENLVKNLQIEITCIKSTKNACQYMTERSAWLKLAKMGCFGVFREMHELAELRELKDSRIYMISCEFTDTS